MAPGLDAIVLAAGTGRRMGGAKGRILIGGVSLARRHLREARVVGCRRVVIVASPEECAWLTRECALDATEGAAPVIVVSSSAPDQAGSLALAVQALGGPPSTALGEFVLITPIDTLPVSTATLASLLDALAAGALAATPTCEGRGGHPAILRRAALARYRRGSAPPAPPLRELLASLGPLRVRVPVDDPDVLTDLDTPEDVTRLTGAPPRFCSEV
ncbi:MAG TPA: NTP transferase domain-containing protein [Polyangiaceae bacterium]|nr:NTP transferase domain-containing protein [Polyangiaceae bacterium]